MSSSQVSKEIDLSNPLIEKRKSTEEDDDEKREMAMFDPERAPPESMDMFKVFLRIAVPSIFTNLSVEVTHLVSYTIAGHIAAEDSHELAALGLALSCIDIFVIFIFIGINSAQETLTSQAFGSLDYQLCGVYLNRGAFILVAFFIPLAVLPSIFAEHIFLSIG